MRVGNWCSARGARRWRGSGSLKPRLHSHGPGFRDQRERRFVSDIEAEQHGVDVYVGELKKVRNKQPPPVGVAMVARADFVSGSSVITPCLSVTRMGSSAGAIGSRAPGLIVMPSESSRLRNGAVLAGRTRDISSCTCRDAAQSSSRMMRGIARLIRSN